MTVVVSMAVVAFVAATPAHAAPGCQNGGVYVVWARGSGQKLWRDSKSEPAETQVFANHVFTALHAAGIPSYAWAELGNLDEDFTEDPSEPDEYPASAVPWANITGQYDTSVFIGVTELIAHLNHRYAPGPIGMGCVSETAILSGFSQGAHVVGWALALTEPGMFGLPALTPEARNHIGFVALYGDPKFDVACGQNRPWVRGYPRCASFPRLGARSPYLPSDFVARTGSWCDDGDGICAVNDTSTIGIGNHNSAYRNAWIQQSAAEIVGAARIKRCSLVATCSGSGASSPSTPVGNPFGYLDEATLIGHGDKLKVSGWAIDPDAGVNPVTVHTYVDGVLVGALTANQPRPDVGAAYPGYGNHHGYAAEYPLRAGTHQVCTYAINTGGGDTNPQLSACQTVRRPGVGDFDTNGTTDVTVFRPSDGVWHIRSVGDFLYGQAGDIPVPGDYDGNGAIEGAVYRPGNPAYWHIRGQASVPYGLPGDLPVPAQWNADKTVDPAIFRPSDGTWHIRGIADFAYGEPGDIPVPGDYDGNGTIEAAVYRPSTGMWHVRGGISAPYGLPGDLPVPAQWNADATTDIAIYCPSDGGWHIRGIADFAYGQPGDIPLVGDFDGNGVNEAAVYRPGNPAYWHIRGGTSVPYGLPGDLPAAYTFNRAILQQLGLA